MKIQSTIALIDNVYHVQVGVSDLSPVEREAVDRFGEPIVEAGGAVSGSATRSGAGAPTAVSFTLPAQQVRMPSEFPVKQVFSLDDSADADVRAKVYEGELRTRMTAARATLLARVTNFVGETVTTVTTA